MWTKETRGRYDRRGLRYPSDLTDAEWALIAPMIPPAKRGGRRREVDVREVLNGLLYVLETGCPWRHLPKDFPPKSTVHGYFDLWAWDGTLERMHEASSLNFLNIYDGGQSYTEGEYREWLTEAGFEGVVRVVAPDGTSIITARKSDPVNLIK